MELTTLNSFTLYASVFGIPLIQALCLLYLIIVTRLSIRLELFIMVIMIATSLYTVYFYYTLPYSELIPIVYFGYWMILVLIPIKMYMKWKHHPISHIGYLALFTYTMINVFFFFEYYGYYYGLIK